MERKNKLQRERRKRKLLKLLQSILFLIFCKKLKFINGLELASVNKKFIVYKNQWKNFQRRVEHQSLDFSVLLEVHKKIIMLLKVNLKEEKKKVEKRVKNLQTSSQKVQVSINILIGFQFQRMVLGKNYLI